MKQQRGLGLCCLTPLLTIFQLYHVSETIKTIVQQYTIMALGRGEYPKLSTPLGLFPEGNNPSGVDNFGYSPIQRTDRNCFIIPNKQLKYTV